MPTATPADASDQGPADAGASSARMMQLITGSFASQVVRGFAELSLADVLAEGPAPADEIAAAIGAAAGATTRLLRAGAALGLVTADGQSRFAPTPLLATLRRDAPGSLRGLAVALASPGTWLPWGNFVAAARTGERQTVAALGVEYFEYLNRHPAEAEFFTAGMEGVANSLGEQAAEIIDTRTASRAADIGGASGALLHALLAANPALRGIVYDLPNVVPAATAAAERLGLAARVSAVAGDFFESVPEADLHLLKWILHDWDDAACIRILGNCRRSLRDGGRVVAVELHLGGMDDPGPASIMDLNMMVMLTGRERTVGEYGGLFAAAGLRLSRVEPLPSPFGPWNVMEAVPA
ncbi:MAG: methyltransferase [Acetobacteraceae bacterium]|nr:methyltransferase [Acetobacteraceae bacterium]